MEFFFQVVSRNASIWCKFLTVKDLTKACFWPFRVKYLLLSNTWKLMRSIRIASTCVCQILKREWEAFAFRFPNLEIAPWKYLKNSYLTLLTAGTQKVIMTLVIIKTKNLKSGNAEMQRTCSLPQQSIYAQHFTYSTNSAHARNLRNYAHNTTQMCQFWHSRDSWNCQFWQGAGCRGEVAAAPASVAPASVSSNLYIKNNKNKT